MIIAWALAAGAAIPLLVFAIECLVGLNAAPAPDPAAPAPDPAAPAPPFAVLIPAHNEAAGIATVVAAVRRQLRPCDRVLVVADNCTDATAEVAMRAGACVCRRTDTARIGKAFALDHGREALRSNPPSVVIVLDADCLPERGALLRLAGTAWEHNVAVQARYLLSCASDAAPLVRISNFAFLVKNLVRQRGLGRLSGSALLQGTGMALPWPMFDRAPLATPSLVEDLRLGLDLVLAGERVRFDEHAGVTSAAASQGAMRSQRTRWEQGSIRTAREYLPKLLAHALDGRPRLLLLAADLLVPPLTLLVSIAGMISGALLLLVLLGGSSGPLLLVLGPAALCALVLALIWRRLGQALLPASALARLPFYLLWKQPVYLGLIGRAEQRWLRTSRLP